MQLRLIKTSVFAVVCVLLSLPLFIFGDLASTDTQVQSSNAPCHEKQKNSSEPLRKGVCEFKAGYFLFIDSEMSDIYQNGGADIQITSSWPVWRWLHLYGGVEFIIARGHSVNDHQSTSIWEIPLSLGLRGIVKAFTKINYYLTVGPRYVFVRQYNDSSFVDSRLSQSGLGGFANAGILFFPYQHWVVDLFFEYSYVQMSFSTSRSNSYASSAQVGGIVFGAGTGYAF